MLDLKTDKINKLLYIPIILYSLLIMYLSDLESVPYVIKQFEIKDKILHFGGYLVFSVLTIYPLYYNGLTNLLNKNNTFKDINISIIYTLIFSIVFAISDEIHQGFVVGRDADVYDLIADILGIIAGIYISKFLILKVEKSKN